MNKTGKICIAAAIAAVAAISVGGGYKLLRHEQGQAREIADLRQKVSDLQQETDAASADVSWSDTGYNYLAIGNSITWHRTCDYWWNEIGMAASTEDKDYVHLVETWLRENKTGSQPDASGKAYDGVCTYCLPVYSWEVQTNDRSEVLDLWDPYLSDDIDLVTIELSENVSDLTTFEPDFREMVVYVQQHCPDAQIIVIDDFWSDEKSKLKKKAIEGLSVDRVDLGEIRGNMEYQAGLGTVVYDADGGAHTIEHDGVAAHPGDKGMQYYADKITELIK